MEFYFNLVSLMLYTTPENLKYLYNMECVSFYLLADRRLQFTSMTGVMVNDDPGCKPIMHYNPSNIVDTSQYRADKGAHGGNKLYEGKIIVQMHLPHMIDSAKYVGTIKFYDYNEKCMGFRIATEDDPNGFFPQSLSADDANNKRALYSTYKQKSSYKKDNISNDCTMNQLYMLNDFIIEKLNNKTKAWPVEFTTNPDYSFDTQGCGSILVDKTFLPEIQDIDRPSIRVADLIVENLTNLSIVAQAPGCMSVIPTYESKQLFIDCKYGMPVHKVS